MKYTLFLYNSAAAGKGAIAIDIVNRNLRCGFPKWDKGNAPEEMMLSFDTGRVAELIKTFWLQNERDNLEYSPDVPDIQRKPSGLGGTGRCDCSPCQS